MQLSDDAKRLKEAEPDADRDLQGGCASSPGLICGEATGRAGTVLRQEGQLVNGKMVCEATENPRSGHVQ